MNRNLGLLAHTTRQVKYDTKGTLFHKHLLRPGKPATTNITMEEVVKNWEDTHDKFSTLKKLGKLFKQINDSHDKDLINQ